jgi:hypothetical protein
MEMSIDCTTARMLMDKRADGMFSPDAESDLEAHISSCPECAAWRSGSEDLGRLLRSHINARTVSARSGLDMMWTRVRAGIEEGKQSLACSSRRFMPIFSAGALAIVVFSLFLYHLYPAGPDRTPYNPRTFEVSVEEIESDIAVVTQLDMGDDLPRVIWIFEDAKS